MTAVSAWTPDAVADALVKVSGLAGGFLAGVGLLVAWYVYCRWWRGPKGGKG